MEGAHQFIPEYGVALVYRAVGLSRSSYYRTRSGKKEGEPKKQRPSPPRALAPQEKEAVLETLHSSRFVDQAPEEVYATLLDEGSYLCSVSTMYRLLRASGEVGERRRQLTHPAYRKPELLATGPNEVWSWDITKLKGPVKWSYFYLYVILDIFSRYVVGWMVAERESEELARQLIEETCEKQGIEGGKLTLHADRGSPMKSKSVAQLLVDLGVTKSHSRPYTSNDNPFSESQFKTLKYRADFPERFGSSQDARTFCHPFFTWYNGSHRHSGIGFMTPESVHYGKAEAQLEIRRRVLEKAYQAHPDRFVTKEPQPPPLPKEVWINPPKKGGEDEAKTKVPEIVTPTQAQEENDSLSGSELPSERPQKLR